MPFDLLVEREPGVCGWDARGDRALVYVVVRGISSRMQYSERIDTTGAVVAILTKSVQNIHSSMVWQCCSWEHADIMPSMLHTTSVPGRCIREH